MSLKISNPINGHKPKTTTLDVAAKRKNLDNILKIGLLANAAHNINSRLIFHDIYIHNSIIALDIKLNLWVLNYLKNY